MSATVAARRLARAERVLAGLAIVAAFVVIRLQASSPTFYQDDFGLLVGSDAVDPGAILKGLWYFQPLSWQLYVVAMVRAVGLDPGGFLTAQIAIAAIVALLGFAVVERVTGSARWGLASTLLWIGAASTGYVLFWTSCVAYLLGVAFVLAMLWAIARRLLPATPASETPAAPPAAGGYALAAACVGLHAAGWLSKNSVLLAPLVLLPLVVPGPVAPWTRRVVAAAIVATGLAAFLVLGPGNAMLAGSSPHTDSMLEQVYDAGAMITLWRDLLAGAPSALDRGLAGHLLGPTLRSPAVAWTARAVVVALLGSALLAGFTRRTARARLVASLSLLALLDLVVTVPAGTGRQIFQAQVSLALALPCAVAALMRSSRTRPPGAARRALGSVMLVALIGLLLASAARVRDPYVLEKRETRCAVRQMMTVLLPTGRPGTLAQLDRRVYDGTTTNLVELFFGDLGLQQADLSGCGPERPDTTKLRVDERVYYLDRIRWSPTGARCQLPPPSEPVGWSCLGAGSKATPDG